MMKTIFSILFSIIITSGYTQKDFSDSDTTKLVLLGTGVPGLSPTRLGCSVAIVVNGSPYIIDFGPGLMQRISAMSEKFGGSIKGLEEKKITRAFLTHLHSDHTTGYPDLIFTPLAYFDGRKEPLEVYGPEGLNNMTDHILKAYEEDIKYHLYSDQPADDQGWRVNSHEIKEEGIVHSLQLLLLFTVIF